MQTLPISKIKDKLNEYVDAVSTTHEQVTITKNGSPAAVLVGADEWDALQETLFWLSQPDVRADIDRGHSEIAAGGGYDQKQIRAQFVVPRQGS